MKSMIHIMDNQSSWLYNLSQHCKILKLINKRFNKSLPPPLNQHCHVANWREKTLIVHTDSSLWATRLRYMTPFLIARWQKELPIFTINKIIVKVRPTLLENQ
ncbi:DUF721 domain-containing protein [Candidatus Halobeggiatoa sp. HSG11]|nr:DUF721 domain-containing protein [Candidatus Halobeggiatoa sp. HSG11]